LGAENKKSEVNTLPIPLVQDHAMVLRVWMQHGRRKAAICGVVRRASTQARRTTPYSSPGALFYL